MARLDNAKAGALVTKESTWASYTPRLRSAVIAALVSKPFLINALFDAVERGVVAASDISSIDRHRLMENKDTTISERSKGLFVALEGGERMQGYQADRLRYG